MPAALSEPAVQHKLTMRSSQKDALTLLAKAEGRSVNSLIREAIDELLKKER